MRRSLFQLKCDVLRASLAPVQWEHLVLMVVLTLVPVGINKGSLAPPLESPVTRDVSLGMFKMLPK